MLTRFMTNMSLPCLNSVTACGVNCYGKPNSHRNKMNIHSDIVNVCKNASNGADNL